MNDAYTDIERLTCQAGGYDYTIAISSGIIAGLIDSFFVGEWDFINAKKPSNIEINNKILNFAKRILAIYHGARVWEKQPDGNGEIRIGWHLLLSSLKKNMFCLMIMI